LVVHYRAYYGKNVGALHLSEITGKERENKNGDNKTRLRWKCVESRKKKRPELCLKWWKLVTRDPLLWSERVV